MRATALRSLARAEAFSASDVIPERLSDPVPEVRLAALDALGALRADRSRARALLTDPDGLVRARAAGHPARGRAGSRATPDGRDVEGDAEAEAVARATHEIAACRRADGRVPRARVVTVRGGDVAGANGARRPDPVRAGGGGAHDDRAWIRSPASTS